MHNDRKRIDLFTVQQNVHLHYVGRPVLLEFIVHRGIAPAHRFEFVKEVQHDFGQRHLVGQYNLAALVGHVHLYTAFLVGQRHHHAYVLLRHVEMHCHDRLANFFHAAGIGHLGGVFHHGDGAVRAGHLVDHAGRGGDQVLVKLALQTLLHNFHVQQAQKSASEPKTQCLRYLGLVVQRGIVELELFKRIAQRLVFAGFGRVQPGKNLWLDLFKAGQCLFCRACVVGQLFVQRDGIAHFGSLQFLDARNDEAHLPRFQRLAYLGGGREHPQVVCVVTGRRGHHANAFAFGQTAIDHPHQHHHTHVGVKPAVDDHGAQRSLRVTLGRGNLGHNGFQNLVNTQAGFGRARNRVGGVDADHVFDFQLGSIWIGVGQVHLVQHRHYFHTQL